MPDGHTDSDLQLIHVQTMPLLTFASLGLVVDKPLSGITLNLGLMSSVPVSTKSMVRRNLNTPALLIR